MTGDQLTVGIVTPHAAAGPEVELPAMTSGRVATVVSRTAEASQASRTSPRAHAELLASTEPTALERAGEMYTGRTLAAVAHASTTTGYALGNLAEAGFVERLSRHFVAPAVASCAVVVAALRAHGVGRVQLVHPPWFDDELDELGAVYFRSQGVDAVVTKAVDLVDDPARVDPQRVVEWVEQHVVDRAEAIFLAGSGFRAAEAIEELELRTGRLIVEANQALLWGILVATGTRWDLTGYGRLLRSSASTP